MPVKALLKLLFLAAAILVSASSFAQDHPRSMLGDFDLKSVILSPAPLGPPSQFEPSTSAAAKAETQPPVAAETQPATAAASDTKPAVAAKRQRRPVLAKSEVASPRKMASSKPRQKSTVAAPKPKANPLSAYARDVRRQTWPCTGTAGGGICAWSQPR